MLIKPGLGWGMLLASLRDCSTAHALQSPLFKLSSLYSLLVKTQAAQTEYQHALLSFGLKNSIDTILLNRARHAFLPCEEAQGEKQ